MSVPTTARVAMALAGGLVGGVLIGRRWRRRRLDLHGAVVHVTGGSRGLGLELARELGRRGARVAPALLPRTTAAVLGLVNRALPDAGDAGGQAHRGRDSEPSCLTRLGQRAARRQNQGG